MHAHLGRAVLLAAVALALPGTAADVRASSREGRAFAAPEILMVYGAPLPAPRVLADQEENLRLLLCVRSTGPRAALSPSAPPPTFAGRPAFRVALFWGREWRDIARSPGRRRALRPEQANQQGVFYPATADAPARLAVGATDGVVSDSGLAILSRHGVPIRVATH